MNAKKTALLTMVSVILAITPVFPALNQCTNPRIEPINATPYGMSYSQWAAAWWTWALQTPGSVNPLTDTTGIYISQNQKGRVWFLAGLLGGGTVKRTGKIPSGTALFFPLTNNFYGAFLTDPDSTKTTAYIRSQVVCVEGAGLSVTIDGMKVRCPSQYLEKSTVFTIHFPVDNVFGVTSADVPQLTLSPVVDEGYYIFLDPLPPGQHTINFTVTPLASCAAPLTVTYNLTVTK